MKNSNRESVTGTPRRIEQTQSEGVEEKSTGLGEIFGSTA